MSLNTGIRHADKPCTSYTVRIQGSIAASDKTNHQPWQVGEGRFLHKSPNYAIDFQLNNKGYCRVSGTEYYETLPKVLEKVEMHLLEFIGMAY